MLRAEIKAFERFGELEEIVDRKCIRALNGAAEEMRSVAAGIGAARGADDIEVIRAHGDLEGFTAGIKGRFYYRFQSFGTLGNAISPRHPGTKRSHAPGTGVKPNRMYQRARTAGRKRLLQLLSR